MAQKSLKAGLLHCWRNRRHFCHSFVSNWLASNICVELLCSCSLRWIFVPLLSTRLDILAKRCCETTRDIDVWDGNGNNYWSVFFCRDQSTLLMEIRNARIDVGVRRKEGHRRLSVCSTINDLIIDSKSEVSTGQCIQTPAATDFYNGQFFPAI